MGFSVFHLEADYHGYEFSDKPRYIKELIRLAHTTLVENNRRKNTTLIVSGGIYLAEHVPKAIICGADLVAINSSILIALQSKFRKQVKVSTNSGIIPEEFDPEWGEQRLVNLISSWHNQLIEILSAMGQRDVRRLVGDIGRAIFQEEEEEAFIKQMGLKNE